MYEIECPCGTTFEAARPHAKYCTPQCRPRGAARLSLASAVTPDPEPDEPELGEPELGEPGDEPAEVNEPAAPKTVAQAANGGTQLELLIAMRGRIAEAIERPDCPPRDLASLSRRLMEIAKEIELLEQLAEAEADAAAAKAAAASEEAAGDEHLGESGDEAFDPASV